MTDDGELLAWCVVANVAAETFHGESGQDVQQGLKHFPPGTKLWVLRPQWGDSESVLVVGRHRGRRHGFARIVVPREHLTDFRVRGVYSPAVYRELTRPWEPWGTQPLRQWETQEDAERVVAWWNSHQVAVSGVRQPRKRGELIEVLGVLAGIGLGRSTVPWAVSTMLNGMFGDPPDPAGAVGRLLRDEDEVAAVNQVLGPLPAIVADLGPKPTADDFRAHPRWPHAAAAAGTAHDLLSTIVTTPDNTATTPTVGARLRSTRAAARQYIQNPTAINSTSTATDTAGARHNPNPNRGRSPASPGNNGRSIRCTTRSSTQWENTTEPRTTPARRPNRHPATAPNSTDNTTAPTTEWV
jgi:hypothetical protein